MPFNQNDPLHDQIQTLIERTNEGKIKWVVPVDWEGNPLDVYKGIDREDEMSYLLSDGRDDEEEADPEYRVGPNITSYCYDTETDEAERAHDGMVLYRYASRPAQQELVALVTLVGNLTKTPPHFPVSLHEHEARNP